MKLDDFLYEIKTELEAYELENDMGNEWERRFLLWCDSPRGKKDVSEVDGVRYIKLKDESEIFEMVDNYVVAVEDGDTEEYWKAF